MDGSVDGVGAVDPTEESSRPVARPNLTGDLDEMLGQRPVFRTRLQGYDRLQVDNYTAWAETEVASLRREVDDLIVRFGTCSAELEISRRLLAEASRSREVFPVSERVQQMLQLAAEEAAALKETGVQEGRQVLAEARAEADAQLRKAHEIKEQAVAAADELADQARRLRADAEAEREKARQAAAELLRQAAADRERLDAEAGRERDRLAAAAADRLAEVQARVDELWRQRDLAREALRGLTDRLGEALQVVATTVPDGTQGTNVAVEGMVDHDEPMPAAKTASVAS
jgi:cell division septum initiation protein DivIVA